MAYERFLKDKIKRLEELIRESENELKAAQNSLKQGELISNEISELNKQTVKLKYSDPERKQINNKVQQLLEDQTDLYWNYFNLSERLEMRKMNLLIFKKYPKVNQDKLVFEKLIVEYGIFIHEIINGNKKIWWDDNGVFNRKKSRFLNLLKEELESVLSKRRKIFLLPKEELHKVILLFEEEKIRKWYGNEEFRNLIEFKKLFHQVHDNYREDVSFF